MFIHTLIVIYYRRLKECCSFCPPINLTDLDDLDEIELCVDEPEETFVDEPEEIIQFLEGVSVDGPPLVTVSQWIGERPKSAIVPCWSSNRSTMIGTLMISAKLR